MSIERAKLLEISLLRGDEDHLRGNPLLLDTSEKPMLDLKVFVILLFRDLEAEPFKWVNF